MNDRLSLKRTDPDSESYAALYDHPEHGKIRIGTISKRTSLGNVVDSWGWTISTNLAPVFSPDHGKVPNHQRTLVKREAVSFAGTAPTLDEALADWKELGLNF